MTQHTTMSALTLQSIVKRFFALMGYGGEVETVVKEDKAVNGAAAAAAAARAAAARKEAARRAQFASSAAPPDHAEARMLEELHALAARRSWILRFD